jgi:hypothetical protein
MACELAGERALDHAINVRGLYLVATALRRAVRSTLLHHTDDRRFFDRLTDGALAEYPWWPDYVKAVALRNGIVHKGARAAPDEMIVAFHAAGAFVGDVQRQAAATPRMHLVSDALYQRAIEAIHG